jgi:hypothetical protein
LRKRSAQQAPHRPMTKEDDHLAVEIGCIDADRVSASLVATHGAYCEVWRSACTMDKEGLRQRIDFVIKRYRSECSLREASVLARQYRELREQLDDIVPAALYVVTTIDGAPSVCVVAETVQAWFNLAHPANEEEAIPLLRSLPKALSQLARFLQAARHWQRSETPRIIDLFGIDNLVLDINHEVRYLDNFHVFFFEDMLYALSEADIDLLNRIEVSAQRLDYLEHLLEESRKLAAD